MALFDTLDLLMMMALLVGAIAHFTKGKKWGFLKDRYVASYTIPDSNKAEKTRDIVERMQKLGKNCIIFYGTQTGTAEDFASRLAKEGKSRFGLETMVADLEDYDFESLDSLPEDKDSDVRFGHLRRRRTYR